MTPNLDFLEETEALTPNQLRERQESDARRSRLVTRHRSDGAALERVAHELATLEQLHQTTQAAAGSKASAARYRQRQVEKYGREALRQRWREYWRAHYRRPQPLPRGKPPKPVVTESGLAWPSAAAAAEALGLSVRRIYDCIQKPWNSAGGHRWKYQSDPRPLDWNYPLRVRSSRAVVTAEGERFPTLRSAANALGCSPRLLQTALKNGRPFRGHAAVYYADTAVGQAILTRRR